MRRLLLMLTMTALLPAPMLAQTAMRQDVERERARYVGSVSPAQVAAILNAVAWSRRGEGWGLLAKPDGAHVWLGDSGPFIAGDILANSVTRHHYDVLIDWDSGRAEPTWRDAGEFDLARFVAAVPPSTVGGGGDTGGGGGGTTTGGASAAEIDRMISAALAAQMGNYNGQRISTADVYAQNERVFAATGSHLEDATTRILAKLEDTKQALATKIDQPGWFSKVFDHPIVKYGLTAFAAVIAQRQFHVFGGATQDPAAP